LLRLWISQECVRTEAIVWILIILLLNHALWKILLRLYEIIMTPW
jgi:hypothetical protein